MNKILFALLSFAGLLCLASCSETEETDTEYENWQAKNDTYFEQQYQKTADNMAANSADWRLIKAYSKDQNAEGAHTDYILVHVLSQKETHDESAVPPYAEVPLYTDSVRVHIRGNLMQSPSYDVESSSFGRLGYQFTTSWYGDYNTATMMPASYLVSSLGDGFATAVMNMHIGDRWEVCIPYSLAYGSTANGSVPAYSTLVLDITLHSFARAGNELPSFQ